MDAFQQAVRGLPISAHLSAIANGICAHPLTLLEASPGSGKTTILPLHLLTCEWLGQKKILILQPRRVAAIGVAMRMAELLDEEVGNTVGYAVRLERKHSARTRIEVITEGLLTKRLVSDPELSDVGLVIFDEFHERSIHSDIGLALTLESLSILRPDLRVLIMSATLGELPPSPLLSGAWRYSFDAAPFPISMHYHPGDLRTPLWETVSASIRSCLERFKGDILAFLPGAYEIERVKEMLEQIKIGKGTALSEVVTTPLYGELPHTEQRRALQADPDGRRKVVLATNIAEKSLTIEGVAIVIDSGLHKVARIERDAVMSLRTEPITRDAADQRAGRAGRTCPGVCVRLWSEEDHRARRAFREPEVLRADLLQPVLDLYMWGVKDFARFNWITPPPQLALESARRELIELGALTHDGAISPLGRNLSRLATHPHLGVIALAARERGLEELGASLIALLEERDPLAVRYSTADVQTRIAAITDSRADSPRLRRLAQMKAIWLKRINQLPAPRVATDKIDDRDACGVLIALAFPRRIARRRTDSSTRYLLASGRGAAINDGDPLGRSEYLATCVLQGSDGDLAIRLAASLSERVFEGALSALVTREANMEVNQNDGALKCVDRTVVGAIVISERIDHNPSAAHLAEAFTRWLAGVGYASIPFNQGANELLARLDWANKVAPDSKLPTPSHETLRESLGDWLIPHLPYPPKLSALTAERVYAALEGRLTWQQRRELDEIAPPTILLPNGKVRKLLYTEATSPSFEARIQELFGLRDTPLIGRNKIKTIIHLLSPAHRPVQVTSDLASFWQNGYPQIRRELRGRYPKHKWPENPSQGS